MSDIPAIKEFLLHYQRKLCAKLRAIDGGTAFTIDPWQRAEGGGGISCVFDQGSVIEKGGVNFSHITGNQLPSSASSHRQEWKDARFEALGVSIVIHPYNPYLPTSHANVRYFSVTDASGKTQGWFGGGFDLTPFYGFHEDCVLWHQYAQAACLPFGEEVYPTFKKACDEYFFLTHRQEARGIGGIFFDDLHEWGFDKGFAFMKSVAEHYEAAYLAILERRKDMPYGQKERDFQLYRRGRYTEFNLLYDRGTLFGLQSGGRTESILMSRPPLSTHRYNYQPDANSVEATLTRDFLPAQDWLENAL